LQNYAKLLREKLESNNVTSNEDYITYSQLVQSMLENLKMNIKNSFLNDDFFNMQDVELRVYLKDKYEFLFQTGSQYMDIWYISAKMSISREELRRSMLALKNDLSEIASDIYNKAITIINEVDKEKDHLKKELDDFCVKIVGIHADAYADTGD